MIFSEVYGSYFNAVAAILGKAVNGELTGEKLTAAVRDNAFGESIMTIPSKLMDGSWPLLDRDLSTPLRHVPSMPLTQLQKQWLKALLQDPRIQLFNPSDEGLEDVEPLYTPDMFVFFDRYNNGDPFGDDVYIRNFRIILRAIREKRKVRIIFENGKGEPQRRTTLPHKLEYSSKDDRFRVICSKSRSRAEMINLGRVRDVILLEHYSAGEYVPFRFRWKTIVMELTDERNTLERCMLHFSDMEKETEKLDGKHYRITLHYEQCDETEILIRILSFGPMLKVTEPESFVSLVRERLQMQARF